MKRRVVSVLVLGLAIAACSDQTPSSPRGLSNATVSTASPSSTDCNFNGLNSLIAQYFTNSTTQQAAKNAVGQMQTAGAQTDGAIEPGFSVMRLIAGTVDGGNAGSASTGATLTAELIKCMFTPAVVDRTFLSTTATPAFTIGLDPTQTGAYEVRGPIDGYSVISSRLTTGQITPISAIAPIPTTAGPTPWSQILDTVPEKTVTQTPATPHSVLIYGHDIPGTTGYDWALIRPDANFKSPYAEVALCEASDNGSTMVNESSIGVLGFVSTDICITGTGLLEREGGPFALVRRMARFGAKLLSPEPLHATAPLLASTIGGSAGGAKSRFTTSDVTSVTLHFSPVPASVQHVNQPFVVNVQATTPDGATVNGVCVFLTATNNNGTPTQLLGTDACSGVGDPSALTHTVGSVSGIASITATDTKTGGIILSANGSVVGRSGSVTPTSTKINVKP